jgi:hypothetical protein
MFSLRTFNKALSLVLLVTLFLATMPVSAADLAATRPLGSVSGAGPVELRGIPITHEGTIFTGDQLSVGSRGYAKIIMVQGQKLEMDQMTSTTIAQEGTVVQLRLLKGNVGFTTAPGGTLEIVAGNYEITSDKPMSGNVVLIGNDFIGIHMNSGAATMRNLFTKQAIRIPGGEERMLTVQRDAKAPVAQVASLLPPTLPPVPPVPMPQSGGGATSGTSGMSFLAKLAIVGGVGAAVAGLAFLAARSPVSGTAGTSSGATALSNDQAAISTANAAASDATAAAAAAAAVAAAVNNATTVSTSTKSTLTATAQSLQAQAQATMQQIATLQIQLQQLQSQLTGASGPTITAIQNQINTITSSLNSQVTSLDNEISSLNSLVAQAVASGVPNVPSVPVTIQPIPPVTLASNSIPHRAY